jgi:hypothetical protein
MALFDFEKRRQTIQSISRRVYELIDVEARTRNQPNMAEHYLRQHHQRSQLSLSERIVPNTPYCDVSTKKGSQYFPKSAVEVKMDLDLSATIDSQADVGTPDVSMYALLDDRSFYVRKIGRLDPHLETEQFDDTDSAFLQVAVDSENQRHHLRFKVVLQNRDDLTAVSSIEPFTELDKLFEESHRLSDSDKKLIESLRDIYSQQLYCSDNDGIVAKVPLGRVDDGSERCIVRLELENSCVMEPSDDVTMPDKEIIARNEEDVFARLIRSDQLAYSELTTALSGRIDQLMNLCEPSKRADEQTTMRNHWAKTEAMYSKQRVWKRVASSCMKGMCDQKSADLQKQAALPALPASWTLNVDGRPAAVPEEEEHTEDAVCMACFDGVSVDANQILFCDGCNAAMHQCCYGVSEIPEGDFFCDRCLAIQSIASEYGPTYDPIFAKDEIKCCLCPLYHGALKPTKDGRWVHMCCALWSELAVISDLNEMSPVDVAAVPIQIPVDSSDGTSRGRKVSRLIDDGPDFATIAADQNLAISQITAPCMFCNVYGGYVVQCCDEDSGAQCTNVFHPLCAWFKGALVTPILTDPSFQAVTRDGIFPSGVNFKFCCMDHSTKQEIVDVGGSGSELSRQFQFSLRNKHKLNEFDLENIPGRGGKKRRKKKANAVASSSGTSNVGVGRVAGANVQKELNPDTYTSSACAYCMRPVEAADVSLKVEANTGSGGGSDAESQARQKVLSSNENAAVDIKTEVSEHKDAENIMSGSETPVTPVDSMDISDPNEPAVKEESVSAPQTSSSAAMTCILCNITVHVSCHVSLGGQVLNGGADWLCDTCTAGVKDPKCVLCPRRNGGYKPTVDETWAHVFCAQHCPGHIKISSNGVIDIHSVPKESKKQKCCICNRKNGSCIRCSCLGCTNYFHPLCGERSGKAYITSRLGEVHSYCSDHIPDGVEKLPSGYWVDPYELQRLRYTLDRARIILDTMCRREKHKRLLCKTDTELFSQRFYRMLDKAKGRKSTFEGEMDVSEIFEDEDVDYVSDTDDYGDLDEAVAPTPDKKQKTHAAAKPGPKDITVKTNWPQPEEVEISGQWTKNGEVKIPKKLYITLAGLELSKYDRSLEENKKDYVRIAKEKTQKLLNMSRAAGVLVFEDERQANEFARNLPQQLIKHMKMSTRNLAKELGKDEGTNSSSDGSKMEKNKIATISKKHQNDEVASEPVTPLGPKSKKKSDAVGADTNSKSKRKLESVEPVELETPAKKSKSHKSTPAPLTPEKSVVDSESKSKKAKGNKDKIFMEEEIEPSTPRSSKKVSFQEKPEQPRRPGRPKSVGPPAAQKKAATVAVTLPPVEVKLDRSYSSKSILTHRKISVASGSRRFDGDLNKSLQDNICFAAMSNKAATMDISSGGFGVLLERCGIVEDLRTGALATAGGEGKWTLSTGQELVALERRLMDVLNEIFLTKDPIPKQENASSDADSDDDNNQLAGDFIDLPTDSLPDYDTFVRRQISISIIKERLLAHGYRCLAEFEKDYYCMLNNGRSVTGENSQVSDL